MPYASSFYRYVCCGMSEFWLLLKSLRSFFSLIKITIQKYKLVLLKTVSHSGEAEVKTLNRMVKETSPCRKP